MNTLRNLSVVTRPTNDRLYEAMGQDRLLGDRSRFLVLPLHSSPMLFPGHSQDDAFRNVPASHAVHVPGLAPPHPDRAHPALHPPHRVQLWKEAPNASSRYVPTGHSVGSDDRAGQKCPAGHGGGGSKLP